jgi:YidC/Oxa1 family membrane protein insertase
MSDNKQSTQQRFLIAAALSMGVLLLWTYLFPPPPKKVDVANTNANVAVANTNTATPEVAKPQQPVQPIAETPDNTPNKVLTIKSPLYQVKFDTKGALATSWVLIKNVSKHGEKILWADGSTNENQIPLELILQDNPKREFPFRLSTGDQNVDAILNEKNYQTSADGEVLLTGNEAKEISFTLKNGDVDVTKTFTFHADSYLSDLKITATRNGQTIANTKLLIGTAIGDQGIKVHNYYHIESEGVAYFGDKIDRHMANSYFKDAAAAEGSLPVEGNVTWAGVGDTYFAMAAIPAQSLQGLEYHATKITNDVEPYYDGIISWVTRSQKTKVDRHLVTAYVPFTADNSVTQIYTGSKDYFTLSEYDGKLVNKNIGEFINYSNYSFIRFFVKPIAQWLLYFLTKIYGVVGNFGIAIIIFTLIFYSFFFPLRWYSSRSFKKAQANAPKMKELQDKLKDFQKKGIAADDPRMRELQMEQLKMTKDSLPIGGCLPLLLQMPLFFAFFSAITIGLDFRQASFAWLPDLSSSDPFHILEFLFAASMAGSMIFTPTAPAVSDEQKMQQKMMTYMMPLMMLWVMWGYPAGLLLYWFFGNIVSFIQQFIINRLNKTSEPPKPDTLSGKLKPKTA